MTVRADDLLVQSRLSRSMLEMCIREEWIVPIGPMDEASFTDADVARAALIADLMLDLNVNAEGVDVILSLVEHVHALRKAVADLVALTRKEQVPIDL